jgi:hypothetical protein
MHVKARAEGRKKSSIGTNGKRAEVQTLTTVSQLKMIL